MVYTQIDLSDNYETVEADDRFGLGAYANGGTVETVQGRYEREWLHLKDDRKVRGYDLRSDERRSRDFVDPEDITVTSETTESDLTEMGLTLYDTEVTVTGTVGTQYDNTNLRNAELDDLIDELPNRGEGYDRPL